MEFYKGTEQFGIFQYPYTQVVDYKLKYCPYGQAGVIYDDDGIHLYSYTTRVITVNRDGWLTCSGLYSMTTRKHITYFLREYYPKIDYYTVKDCWQFDNAINVNTGEIKSIKELDIVNKF